MPNIRFRFLTDNSKWEGMRVTGISTIPSVGDKILKKAVMGDNDNPISDLFGQEFTVTKRTLIIGRYRKDRESYEYEWLITCKS